MITIDKNFLKEYKSLLIVLENCDVYEISTEDILDVYCKAKSADDKKNRYSTDEGFIKISARASKTKESFVRSSNEMEGEWDHCLKERLEMCDGGADVTSFSLKKDKKQDIDIYLPYDPLVSILSGGEIELSNCPSYEVDNDGNMIIAFGSRSKQPRRKDNNYSELIVGWRKAFGAYQPKTLKVKAKELSTFGEGKTNLSFSFKICDKATNKDFAELVFIDCKDIAIETSFPRSGDCIVVMSKMTDGRIYVGFHGLGIDFICTSVIEYEYYRKQEG